MKVQLFAKAVLVLVVAKIFCACSSTESQNGDDGLDINLKKQAVHEAPTSNKESTKVSGADGLTIPANAVVEWQKFFKPAPTKEQRSLLEKKLTAKKSDKNIESLIEDGRNEEALGRLVSAEANFRQAFRMDDTNRVVLQELAQLYLRMRQTRPAFEFLAQLKSQLENAPEKDVAAIFRYRYTLAMGYLQRGETEKGHKVLSDLIAIDKTFTPGYAALASSYIKLGKHNVADFIARRGLDRSKEDASLYNILGLVEKKSGSTESARSYFNKSLQINSTYTPAMVNRATLLIDTGDYDAAEADLKQALAYAPADTSIYVTLGICQKKMGRFDAAMASFNKAIELDPENSAARFNLGVLMADQYKKPNQALRLFHEVMQSDDGNSDIREMARLYIEDIKDNQTW